MASVRQWMTRLEALAGVLPGEVSESAEAYFRMMGSVFVALAIVMVILARVVGLVYLQPVILPAIGQIVPVSTTTSTVIKVLPPYKYSPPGYPYGFWDSRRDKSFFARDPHVHAGDRVTMSWGYGGYLRHIIVNGHFFNIRVVIPFPLELAVLLVGGTWFLAVLLAFLCFRNARRIHRDRQTVPQRRMVTVESAWCPWTEQQALGTAAPLAYPVFARDTAGHRLVLRVPATIRPALSPGMRFELASYPHTHAVDPASVSGRSEPDAPTRQMSLQTLLSHLNIATISPQARALWRLLTGVRLLSAAGAVFALYLTWTTLPATVPDWFPISTSHPTVTRVYTPYTFEPAYFPFEIAASDGHLYWFAHDPHLRRGDTLSVRRDAIGGFLSMSHGGFSGSAGRHDQPLDVIILIGVSLAALWRARSWVPAWDLSSPPVTERVTLVKGLSLLELGYPVSVRTVTSGRTFQLTIPREHAREAARLLHAAVDREFLATYFPHSHLLATLDVPDVGSLEIPQPAPDGDSGVVVEEVRLVRGLLVRGSGIPFLNYTIAVRSIATDKVRYLRVLGRHAPRVTEFLAAADERGPHLRVAYRARSLALVWLEAPGMERLEIAQLEGHALDDLGASPIQID